MALAHISKLKQPRDSFSLVGLIVPNVILHNQCNKAERKELYIWVATASEAC